MNRLATTALLLTVALTESYAASPPEPLGLFNSGSDLDAAVYPLGWAENGSRLALLTALPWEAADERRWTFTLTDLGSGQLVASEIFGHPGDGRMESFWTSNEARITALCETHGVVLTPMSLHPFPAIFGQHREDFYESRLTVHREKEPNFGYTGIQKLTLTLTKNGAASKTILDKTWPGWFPLAADVVGYVPNPDHSRIAVLTAIVGRGWEGAPHTRLVIVTGAHIGEKF